MAERASESEMQVLSALWDDAPQTATDLTNRIGKANGWTQATVKTLLARLVQKGAVTTEAEGRRYLYSPAIERAEAVGEAATSAVVTGILLITIAASVMTIVYYQLGI